LKTLHWQKINDNAVEKTIWIKSGIVGQISKVKLDLPQLENMFTAKKASTPATPITTTTTATSLKSPTEIRLIEGKRIQQLCKYIPDISVTKI
jgi:hypothetical protein